MDVIIRVDFNETSTEIVDEEAAALPTQLCKAHRLLPLKSSVLATELATSTVTQLFKEPGAANPASTDEHPA
jgi:virginiamycin B lyase